MKRQKVSKSRLLLERITSVYLVLMLSVFLLYPGTQGYQELADAKFNLFLILCGGYCAIMILLSLEYVLIGEFKFPSIKTFWHNISWTQCFVLLYLCFTWIATVLSPYWPDTILGFTRKEGALTITIYCICFFLVSRFGNFRKWMLWMLCAVVLVFDLLCLCQLTGSNLFGLYPEGMTYFDAFVKYSGAFLGTIGNVDLVAAFLCIVVPMLWIGVIRLPNRTEKLVLFITLLLTLIVLWKMWVLAAIVGTLVGAVVCAVVVLPTSPKRKKALSVTLIVLCGLAILLLYFVDTGSGFLHEMHELLHGRAKDEFGSGRIYIWRNVLHYASQRLLFGHGPDTMIHLGLSFSRTDLSLGTLIQANIDTAHNEYLNILYHQGIFALAAYLLAICFALVGWVRTSAKDPIAAMAGGAVLCYCIQALFGISTCITAPYFWLALALLDRRTHKRKETLK